MHCPKCGYALGPFDLECPRCRRIAEQYQLTPPDDPTTTSDPAAEPWPIVRRRPFRNLATLVLCIIGILILIAQLRKLDRDAQESWRELAPEVHALRRIPPNSPTVSPVIPRDYQPLAPNPPAYNPPVSTPTPRSWIQIASWSGNNIKSTPAFTVGDEWAIEWATQPGQYGDMNFAIIVKGADDSWAGLDANIIGAGADTSYHYEAGTYHLEINSGQPWIV